MRVVTEPLRAWPRLAAADRVRIWLAWGFVFGAVSHFAWLAWHGDLFYHGPAPRWAVWFWFALCAFDFVVYWLLLTHPRAGILAACATMMVTLGVNWTQFPTFEFQFNYVLLGLTVFGLMVLAMAPWLWRASRWRLGADQGDFKT